MVVVIAWHVGNGCLVVLAASHGAVCWVNVLSTSHGVVCWMVVMSANLGIRSWMLAVFDTEVLWTLVLNGWTQLVVTEFCMHDFAWVSNMSCCGLQII
jgi:hypothetical protein